MKGQLGFAAAVDDVGRREKEKDPAVVKYAGVLRQFDSHLVNPQQSRRENLMRAMSAESNATPRQIRQGWLIDKHPCPSGQAV